MTKRSELNRRVHSLGEIKSILGAMKSLAIVEINKVSRYLGAETEFGEVIAQAIGDFRHYHSAPPAFTESSPRLYILIGSERGFCGGFNEALLSELRRRTAEEPAAKLIVVGRKLGAKLEGDPRVVDVLDGASAAEEIAATIAELARKLVRYSTTPWALIFNQSEDAPREVAFVNPFAQPAAKAPPPRPLPPLLNLAPEELYRQFFEQYLFSTLYRAFYLSFLAENRNRLAHMEGALRALDRQWSAMKRLSNALRQEEITEELEVIMLSVDAGAD